MKHKNALVLTYQTRLSVEAKPQKALEAYAELMSRVERSLFSCIMAGMPASSLKSEYLKKFGITARQFNACRVEIEGKIQAQKVLNHQRIADLEALIHKLEKKKRSTKKQHFFKQRRLNRLRHKLHQLKEDRSKGIVRICFGTRKLFRKQFAQSPDQWKIQWKNARNHSFFTLGSKDETSGNQTCTAKENEDGSLTLRLRLPNALHQDHGKYLEFSNVFFSYGHQKILSALDSTAISYRFHQDKKGWRLFPSIALPEPTWKSESRLGVIGVDINIDHLAVVETDRFGNPLSIKRIPCTCYGKTQKQSLAEIGDAAVSLVDLAVASKKPLVLERLDFQKKKQELKRNPSCHYKRMLSSFAYNRIQTAIQSRAYRDGIHVYQVNPAYSSLLGRLKFSRHYGLTIHQAAALCIGRRFLGLSEKLASQTHLVSDNRGSHVTFSVPVRNRKTHAWTHLSKVLRKLQAALAEHFRVIRHQSSDPPLVGL